jgi:hypothetical protein
MSLHLFRHKSRRHEFEDEHQPNAKGRLGSESGDRPHVVAPTDLAAPSLREPDTDWPWWLSSPETEGTPSSRVWDWAAPEGQPLPVQHAESGEPTSLPAASERRREPRLWERSKTRPPREGMLR